MILSPIRIKKTFKTLSAVGMALFLFSCGGGGGPGVPSAPSVAPLPPAEVVVEEPVDTTIFGTVQGIAEGEVLLLDQERKERGRARLNPDGTYEIKVKLLPSEGGSFLLVASDEMQAVILTPGQQNVGDVSQAGFLGMILSGAIDPEENLEDAIDVAERINFIATFIATPQEIQAARDELRDLTPARIFNEFLIPNPGGRDAIRELQRKVIVSD